MKRIKGTGKGLEMVEVEVRERKRQARRCVRLKKTKQVVDGTHTIHYLLEESVDPVDA